MASQEIHLVAFVTPAPGKLAALEDAVKDVVAGVQAHEPDMLAYQAFVERKKNGDATVVFVER
jgi:quinol monooxygenase YgiN